MKYLIIGNGIAGISAAGEIRKKAPGSDITVLTDESSLCYARFLLPWYLEGRFKRKRLWCRTTAWYRQSGVRLVRNARAEEISTAENHVKIGSGRLFHFDRLLLATGSETAPPCDASLLNPYKNYFPLHSKEDAEAIRTQLKQVRACHVIGGGGRGIQTAVALRAAGKTVCLLEQRKKLLPDRLDDTASSLLEKALADMGISVLKSVKVVNLAGTPPAMKVMTENGGTLETGLAVSVAGSRPRTALARSAGIPVRRGILADLRLATDLPGIFAAGEAADIENRVPVRSWDEALRQGLAAGANMAGETETIGGRTDLFSLCIGPLCLISYGLVDPWNVSGVNIASRLSKNGYYRKAVIEDNHVIGLLCMGDLSRDGIPGMIWDKNRILETLCGLPAGHPEKALDRLDLLVSRTYRGLSISLSDFPFLFG
jgi:nitrite reductase (NADH) large subunit